MTQRRLAGRALRDAEASGRHLLSVDDKSELHPRWQLVFSQARELKSTISQRLRYRGQVLQAQLDDILPPLLKLEHLLHALQTNVAPNPLDIQVAWQRPAGDGESFMLGKKLTIDRLVQMPAGKKTAPEPVSSLS